MSNRIFATAALVAMAACGFAETRWGQVELAFFKWRGDDGVLREYPTQGIVLPVKMERIEARPYFMPRKTGQSHDFSFQATKIYENNRGSNNFYDPDGPSSLDDLFPLPSGNGQWWSDLTLGVATSTGNSVKVMNRQLGWSSYVQGRGDDIQAFDGLVFDVGWVFQPGQFPAGTWQYTIPIQQYWSMIPDWNKPRVPNGQIFFAQEWRANSLNGEGAFLQGTFSPIFSGDGGPTVGGSEDVFWNDFDPAPNGIFDETEADTFGGPPNEANFLCTINSAQSGVTDVVRPFSVTVNRGKLTGGNLASVQFVDQNYYRVNKFVITNASEAPVQVTCEGFATTGLTALALDVMSAVTTTGLKQKLEAYNFTTGQYVQVDDRTATTSDTRLTVGVPGNPNDYVDVPNGNIVRLKISYKPFGPVAQASWGCKIDLANWLATHP